MRLSGKVAVVTGGGRGIGREIALALAREGTDVAVAARSVDEIGKVAGEIRKLGRKGIAVKTDVRSEKEVRNLVKEAADRLGRIGIVVNDAGVALRKPLAETSEEEWDNILDTNLKGTFLCCREAIPKMAGEGVIVNISSGAGKRGIPNLSAYCASKFGVIGLTESLARELAGIKVYAICPGGVDTGMYRSMFRPKDTASLLRPEYVAKRVVELCLPGCRVETGASVEVYW